METNITDKLHNTLTVKLFEALQFAAKAYIGTQKEILDQFKFVSNQEQPKEQEQPNAETSSLSGEK